MIKYVYGNIQKFVTVSMREKLLAIALIGIAISLSGCTGISSIHLSLPWNSPTSTPQPPSVELDSVILNDTIPTQMIPGQVYQVSITAYNTGYLPWSNANRIMLTPYNNASNDADIFNNTTFTISPGTIVNPYSDYTWSITMVAPEWIGNYTVMYSLEMGNNTCFGDTVIKNVTVGDLNLSAVVVSQGATWYPPIGDMTMQKGAWQNVSITFKNMGRFGWSDAGQVWLAAVDYQPNDATKFNPSTLFHIAPEETITPGEQGTWRFKIQAPDRAGTYYMEYRMKQEDQWFGQTLNVTMTVY
jgi:hypothetical protein